MTELYAKLEDAEAGLKSAKAEAHQAKERLKVAEQELSTLRTKVISRTSCVSGVRCIEVCRRCKSMTKKVETVRQKTKKHPQKAAEKWDAPTAGWN